VAVFVSAVFWKAALDKLGGKASYKYATSQSPPWSDFGLEAQASIVENWFARTDVTQRPPKRRQYEPE
jgi:hypothetical protein